MEKKKFWLGMLAAVLAAGLVLGGCKTDEESDPINLPPTVIDVQLYTMSWNEDQIVFTQYTGTGATQTVTGKIQRRSGEASSIGTIGTISADGKLTLNIPASIEEGMLMDISEEAGIAGLKQGILEMAPHLYPVNDRGDYIIFGYFNRSGTFEDISFYRGWNYIGEEGVLSNIDGFRWIIWIDEEPSL